MGYNMTNSFLPFPEAIGVKLGSAEVRRMDSCFVGGVTSAIGQRHGKAAVQSRAGCRVRMNSEKPDDGLTVQERMAKTLGRTVEEEKKANEKRREEMEERMKRETKEKYIKLLVGLVGGVGAWVAVNWSSTNPVVALHGMEELSPSYEVAMKNTKPTLLEFYTDWCGYCKEMAPVMSDLETKYASQINFVIMNGENEKYRDLISAYHVDGVPHFALVNGDGKLETTIIGKVPKEILAQDFDAMINKKELPFLGLDLDELP